MRRERQIGREGGREAGRELDILECDVEATQVVGGVAVEVKVDGPRFSRDLRQRTTVLDYK